MLLCRFYQRIISGCLDASRDLPSHLRQHLQQCPSCRSYHDAAVALSDRLSIEAGNERQMLPPFLHGRIVASLEEDRPPIGRMIVRPIWSTALAALALVLAGICFLNLPPKPENQIGASVSAPASPSSPAEILTTAVPLPTREALRVWTQKLNQPLETELQSVIQDARTAIDLLAYNFLPDAPAGLR